MDYVRGDHLTADQGCVWMYGCMSKSVGAGLDCGLGCMPALTVTQRRCRSSMRLVVL